MLQLHPTIAALETAASGAAGVIEVGTLLALLLVPVVLALMSRPCRRHLAMVVGEDPLRARGSQVPDPWTVLMVASGVGALVLLSWSWRDLFPIIEALYAEGGPAEALTFGLHGVATLLSVFAALHWPYEPEGRLRVRGILTVGALVLLGLGLEGVSWGHGVMNPTALTEGLQLEQTSLPQWLGSGVVTAGWVTLSLLFFGGAVVTSASAWFRPREWSSGLCPHPSLLPLAAMAAYSGIRLDPEVFQFLLALFFALHTYRLNVAARSGVGSFRRTDRLRRREATVLSTVADRGHRSPPQPGWWSRTVERLPWSSSRKRSPLDSPAGLTVPVQFLEHTHDPIIIWEMGGDDIMYWNRAAEETYGYTRREAIGRVTHELLKTQLLGGVSLIEEHLARFGMWLGELRHTCRDGSIVTVEARLALISQESGRWLVLETNRDISDRRAAERAARMMEQQVSVLQALRERSR